MTVRLQELVDAARESAERRRRRVPESSVRSRAETLAAEGAGPGRLRRALTARFTTVIAEVKAASPLAGPLRQGFDAVGLARSYAEHGAAAISVLTEERYFEGRLGHLEAVARAVELPVLRKDFVVEPYQVYEAAAAAAAAVLLIADVLEPARLRELVEVARGVGLDALVEFHRREDLEAAVESGSGLVGVNNRDLDTMEVDPGHSLRMAAELPEDLVKVSESGIESAAQVRSLGRAGYDAVLVGTALVRSDDPGARLRSLMRR